MVDIISNKLDQAVNLQQQGKMQESVSIYQDILIDQPENETANVNLGIINFQNGNHEQAFSYLNKAVALHPKSANVHFNLAHAKMISGKLDDAIVSYQKSLSIQSNNFNAQLNLANSLFTYGNLSEASNHFIEAYKLKNDSIELLNNWANCCIRLKTFGQAEKILNKAVSLFPDKWEVHANQGALLKEKWQLAKAEKAFKKAISLGGNDSKVYHSLGAVYHNWNKKEKALSCIEKALNLDPDNLKLHSDYLFHLNYYSELDSEYLIKKHQEWAIRHAPLTNLISTNPTFQVGSPLRVGLLSGDFCYHPVSVFLLGWLEKLDPEKITLHAYAEVQNRDRYTKKVKNACQSWTETNQLTDAQIAKKIKSDGIHILIDLSGHTKGNRLPVMSYKAAPVQATYLGYINTTGVEQIDYRITDELADPQSSQSHYTEKLAYMPHSFTCYEPVELSVKIKPLPALRNGFITFGSFNNPTKLNPSVAKLWTQVLEKVPNSKLLLKARHFSEEEGKEPIIALFKKEGLNTNRLIFEGPSHLSGYLEAHNQVDICLDTFPHNGGTTTHDALLMGVPVLGLAGNRYVGRMGISIMHNLGHPEWIAQKENGLVEKAVDMAADLEKLAKTRIGLREKFLLSSLCDGKIFSKQMESLLLKIWENKQSNK